MGEPFTLSVTIKNQGNAASGDFFWEWWATITAPTYACRAVVSSIASGADRTVTCPYTYWGWANYTTRAIADSDNGVDESNEGNNTHSENLIPIHD
jgi:subtilase family serine protease